MGSVQTTSNHYRHNVASLTHLSMSDHELALVKDVGFLSPGIGYRSRSISSGTDLRITESGIALSPAGRTIAVGGSDMTSIVFEDVERIRIKKDSMAPDLYILTVSYYQGGRHWWRKRGMGEVVLRNFQLDQVVRALSGLPNLKGKLAVPESSHVTDYVEDVLTEASKDVRYNRVFRSTLALFLIFSLLFLASFYLSSYYPSSISLFRYRYEYYSAGLSGFLSVGLAYRLLQLNRLRRKFKNTGYDYPYPKDAK